MRSLVALLLLVAALLLPKQAMAHATLLGADPADGSVVATAPANLSLTFNEPVSPTVLSLIGPDGRDTSFGPAQVTGKVLSIPAPPDLGRGSYALSWRVISADGHPVGGSVVFSIGAPSAGGVPALAVQNVDMPVRIGTWVARLMTYVGLFVGVGGVFFAATMGARARQPFLLPALVLGLIALPADILFEGLDALDRPITALAAPAVWLEGLQSSYGSFVVLAALALLAAIAAVLSGRRLAAVLAPVALLLIGIAFAITGHASAADPQWLTQPAVAAHTIAVTFWIGALLPLARLLRAAPRDAVPALRKFSAAIPAALAGLLLSGLVLAVIQLAAPDQLLTTDYGRVFVAKMLLVAALLALAAYNRWRLTGPSLAGDTAHRRRLARTIGIEMGLALMVFGVVGLWRFTPPPRALLEAAAVPAEVHIHTGDGAAELTLTPGHAGRVAASIYVMGADMGPLPAKEVTLQLGNQARGIEPITRKATLRADGYWHVPDLTLPVGGEWQVEVDVLVSDFQMIELTDAIAIRP